MTATIDSVFQAALQLTEESRLSLVERLIVSSDSYGTVEIEQAKIAESRLAEMRAGTVQGSPVEDALQRVRASLKSSIPA